MKSRNRIAVCFCFAISITTGALAQEGHPMKGSWIGKWQANSVHGESVLLLLDWDGKAVSGIINPGTDNIAISKAELNPNDWTIRVEARAETDEGEMLNYAIVGQIEKLDQADRAIVGTWHSELGEGTFDVVRQ